MNQLHKDNIKVSVITVVMNGAEFITETIESVLNQSYSNIEYIIIDGLSTDGTVEIIQSYESKIAHSKSEKDQGIADAFNKGYAASTGNYIFYLNADDKLAHSEVVFNMVKAIQAHELPALIYGDINYINRSSGMFQRRVSITFSPTSFLRGHMIPHPGLFAHRNYFERYGVFDISFAIAMDYEWLLRGVFKERIVYVPMLISCFRDGGVSTINNQRVNNEIILALKKNGYSKSKFYEAKLRIYFCVKASAKLCLNFLRYSSNISSKAGKPR